MIPPYLLSLQKSSYPKESQLRRRRGPPPSGSAPRRESPARPHPGLWNPRPKWAGRDFHLDARGLSSQARPPRGRSGPGWELAPPRRKLTVWQPGGGQEGERRGGERRGGKWSLAGRREGGKGRRRGTQCAGPRGSLGAGRVPEPKLRPQRQPLLCAEPRRERQPKRPGGEPGQRLPRDSAESAVGGMVVAAAGRRPAQPPPTPAWPWAL